MNRRAVRSLMDEQNGSCAWCGQSVTMDRVQVVERPRGPIGFCDSCMDRYQRPDLHPYLRKCLEVQGR